MISDDNNANRQQNEKEKRSKRTRKMRINANLNTDIDTKDIEKVEDGAKGRDCMRNNKITIKGSTKNKKLSFPWLKATRRK